MVWLGQVGRRWAIKFVVEVKKHVCVEMVRVGGDLT